MKSFNSIAGIGRTFGTALLLFTMWVARVQAAPLTYTAGYGTNETVIFTLKSSPLPSGSTLTKSDLDSFSYNPYNPCNLGFHLKQPKLME